MRKSVDTELENALLELFSVLDLTIVTVENNLEIEISNFVRDIKRVIDEIKQAKDLARMWHISEDLAYFLLYMRYYLVLMMNFRHGLDLNIKHQS